MFRKRHCAASCFVALSLLVLGAAAQDADGPPSGNPESPTSLRQLVQRLGDASYEVRYEAAQEIARRGSSAKEVLTEALKDSNPEIRSRAQFVLNHLLQVEKAESVSSPLGGPAPTKAQRAWVQQLGSPSFSARELAAESLRCEGMAARAVLIEALKNPDYEIRGRARRILERVREEEFEGQLEAFIADVDGTEQHALPGWKRFRESVGDSRRSRTIFAQMIRSESPLLSAYENKSPELSELYTARFTWVRENCASGNSRGRLVPPQTMASLLLVGSDKTATNHSASMSQLYQLLNDTAMMQSMEPPSYPTIMHVLLEQWVASMSGSGSSYGMMMALKYDLEETGLQQATQFLEKGLTSSSALHYAIITIGRFGGREHVPLLKPLLENKTVCHRWSNSQLKKNGTINVEVRDAALVVLLRLEGKDPAEHGFKLLRENPETLYYVYTFGFIEDEEREAAHAEWAAKAKAEKDGPGP